MQNEKIISRISRVESNLAKLDAGVLGESLAALIKAARAEKDGEKLNELWKIIRANYNAIENAPKLSNATPTLPDAMQTDWDSNKSKALLPAALAFATIFMNLWKQRGNTVNVNGKTIGMPFATAQDMAENMVAQAERNMMERYGANIWDGTLKGINKQTWREPSEEENTEDEG